MPPAIASPKAAAFRSPELPSKLSPSQPGRRR